MISTRNLSLFPDVNALKCLMQSMAMLDAILMPEWQYRYYSFNANWGKGEEMGSMRNGSGDDIFMLFNKAGCFLKGFAHESIMSPYHSQPPQVFPGVFEGVPAEFSNCLQEPAFKITDATFCVWRRYSDDNWQRGSVQFPEGNDPDGSMDLLSPLDGSPETYKNWAEEYYEHSIKLSAVEAVYGHPPLDQKLVNELNPDLSLSDLQKDMDEIGYPSK